jgi:predicted tellurium resistance membrane protein TerC
MELFSVENLLALLTLTLLEVVLGIDNLVVLAIVTGKLPREKQTVARRLGLGAAMLMRILLLLSLSWLMGLKKALFTLGPIHPTARDLILIAGGIFLIGKATFEIHDKLEGEESTGMKGKATSVLSAVIQITLLDIVFSLDSVITAIGMAREVKIMIVAIVIAVIVMLIFVGTISHFIEHHPTIKILALSFLLLIGFVLVAEGFGQHVEKGYIYFSMGFALLVEMLNLRLHKKMVIPDTAEPYTEK